MLLLYAVRIVQRFECCAQTVCSSCSPLCLRSFQILSSPGNVPIRPYQKGTIICYLQDTAFLRHITYGSHSQQLYLCLRNHLSKGQDIQLASIVMSILCRPSHFSHAGCMSVLLESRIWTMQSMDIFPACQGRLPVSRSAICR